MKNILIGLDAVANLLDKKGLAKYAAQVDEITESIATPAQATWGDKITSMGNLVKDLELSNPLFLRFDKVIQGAMHASDKELGIKDFVGDVEVPNKVAFGHFLKELQAMIDQDITFTKDDEDLINELYGMTQRG
jgi:hypothetical protein